MAVDKHLPKSTSLLMAEEHQSNVELEASTTRFEEEEPPV